MQCPDDNEIAAWTAGSLDAEMRAEICRHLAGCSDCRSFVSALAQQSAWGQSPVHAQGAELFSPGETVVERYRITRFIAKGGMGELYEAQDLLLDERVAIKIAARDLASDAELSQMLVRETRFARRITHPNVCRVHDIGRVDDTWFVSMALEGGETLRDRLSRSGKLTPSDAMPLVEQMAEALEAVHVAGLIHRDFKSSNVLVSDDGARAVLCDFGLACERDATSEIDARLAQAGSPNYMAPEQVLGDPLTFAVDIYAFGVVLYEMVTGALPFVGETPVETALKRLHEAPPSPRVHTENLDPVWERVILRCLARDPNDRFRSPREIVRALSESACDVRGCNEDADGQVSRIA